MILKLASAAFFSILLVKNGECENTKASAQTEKLVNNLLGTYNPHIRPGAFGKPTPVKFDFQLLHADIDDTSLSIYVHAFLEMEWVDESLTWNPRDYGGINFTYVLDSQIWTPPVIVADTPIRTTLNGAGGLPIATLISNGTVLWFGSAHIKVYCNLDLTIWPFDTQSCGVTFMPYYDTTEINFTSVALATFYSSTEEAAGWGIKGVTPSEASYTDLDGLVYEFVKYNIVVKRITLPYYPTVIIPTIAIILMTSASLWIPTENKTKAYLYAITILATTTLKIHFQYVLLLSHMGNNPPIIISLTSWSLMLTTISMIVWIILLQKSKSTNDIPKVVRVFLIQRWTTTIFRLDSNVSSDQQELIDRQNESDVEDQQQPTEQASPTETVNHKHAWLLFSNLINRILFGVYLLTLLIWLCKIGISIAITE